MQKSHDYTNIKGKTCDIYIKRTFRHHKTLFAAREFGENMTDRHIHDT